MSTGNGEALTTPAAVELRRAYAGTMTPDQVPHAIAAALTHAAADPRRVRRAQNPVGYLYRAGRWHAGHGAHQWARWEVDDTAPDVDRALSPALSRLSADQAAALWLVRACGWTNVQSGEALDLTPATIAAHVAEGAERLEAALDTPGPDIDAQLRALAEHRLASTPLVGAAMPDSTPDTADSQPSEHGPRRRVPTIALVIAAGIVAAVIGGVVLWSGDSPPDLAIEGVGFHGSMHARGLAEQRGWTSVIESGEAPSTFALARVDSSDPVEVANAARAGTPFLPGSTIAPLLALVALDVGVMDSVDAVIPWDGVTRDVPTWNQDQTLRTAVQESMDWVFRSLAPMIGADRTEAALARSGYGNENIGGDVGSFWLDGDLRTSAIDQLEFFEQLALGALPFDPVEQGQVQSSLLRLDGPASRASYVTGTAGEGADAVAWLAGIVDSTEGQWVFAYNSGFVSDGDDRRAPTPQERLDAVLELLAAADVM